MREIRTSGLMRGRATALPTLPLTYFSLPRQGGFPHETEALLLGAAVSAWHISDESSGREARLKPAPEG